VSLGIGKVKPQYTGKTFLQGVTSATSSVGHRHLEPGQSIIGIGLDDGTIVTDDHPILGILTWSAIWVFVMQQTG